MTMGITNDPALFVEGVGRALPMMDLNVDEPISYLQLIGRRGGEETRTIVVVNQTGAALVVAHLMCQGLKNDPDFGHVCDAALDIVKPNYGFKTDEPT